MLDLAALGRRNLVPGSMGAIQIVELLGPHPEHGPAPQDLNLDGVMDLVVANRNDNNASVLLGKSIEYLAFALGSGAVFLAAGAFFWTRMLRSYTSTPR